MRIEKVERNTRRKVESNTKGKIERNTKGKKTKIERETEKG